MVYPCLMDHAWSRAPGTLLLISAYLPPPYAASFKNLSGSCCQHHNGHCEAAACFIAVNVAKLLGPMRKY
jgi:hypothetical protein